MQTKYLFACLLVERYTVNLALCWRASKIIAERFSLLFMFNPELDAQLVYLEISFYISKKGGGYFGTVRTLG